MMLDINYNQLESRPKLNVSLFLPAAELFARGPFAQLIEDEDPLVRLKSTMVAKGRTICSKPGWFDRDRASNPKLRRRRVPHLNRRSNGPGQCISRCLATGGSTVTRCRSACKWRHGCDIQM